MIEGSWLHAKKSLIFTSVLVLFVILMILAMYGLVFSLLGGFAVAYVLEPFVVYLGKRKVSRTIATPIVLFMGIIIITLVSIFIVPFLYEQSAQIISLIPNAIQTINEVWLPNLEEFLISTEIADAESIESFFSEVGVFDDIGNQALFAIKSIWDSTPALFARLLDITLVPVIAFMTLIKWPKIKLFFASLVPFSIKRRIMASLTRVDRKMRAFTKGILSVAFILSCLYMAGFSVMGLKFAIAIGLIAGMCRVVPYLDILVGGVLCLLTILANFTGWSQVIICFGFIATVQLIDGMIITPKIIGDSIGLHPVLIILTVLTFGYWLGFLGVIIAPPCLVLGSVIAKDFLHYYKKSPFYLS